VYPWVAQTTRFGRAFLILEKNDLAHEGHVLTRSALEHALMAHWVAITGDAGVAARYSEDDRLAQALVKDAKGSARDVAPSPWDRDLLQQLVSSQTPVGVNEEKVAHKISEICNAIGVGNSLYPAYRLLSWFAHPTVHAAPMYLEDLGSGHFALRDQPADPAPGGNLGMMTHCVYWARRVLDDLTTGHPHASWLDEIAESIQVMPRLPGVVAR